MLCKICNREMENRPVTVDNWVCTNNHGGTQPRIGAAPVDCPVPKGAIWVHVIDDDGEDVPGIPSTVAGKEKKTKAGFAGWDPLDDNSYHNVEIGKLPDDFLPLAITTAKDVRVRKGEITSVQFVLERAAQMKVIVRVGDQSGSVEDIQIDVAGKYPSDKRDGKTVKDTGALFEKLHKGEYTATITLDEDQKKKYWIDGDASKSCDVAARNPNEVVFTLQLIIILKIAFRIQQKIAAKFEELAGARVKLKDPAVEKTATLKENKALAEFEVMHASREPKTTVDLVSLTPDDTDAVYEFISLESE